MDSQLDVQCDDNIIFQIYTWDMCVEEKNNLGQVTNCRVLLWSQKPSCSANASQSFIHADRANGNVCLAKYTHTANAGFSMGQTRLAIADSRGHTSQLLDSEL